MLPLITFSGFYTVSLLHEHDMTTDIAFTNNRNIMDVVPEQQFVSVAGVRRKLLDIEPDDVDRMSPEEYQVFLGLLCLFYGGINTLSSGTNPHASLLESYCTLAH